MSGPFLRKPIPRMDAVHLHDAAAAVVAATNSSSSGAALPGSYTSVASFDTDDSTNHHVGKQQQQQHPPLHPQQPQHSPTTTATGALDRHLTLTDLIAIGVGGTIGSGLFVLAGLVAHRYAGPSAILSWVVSGVAAGVSAVAYAELAARIPLPGGAYAYAYVAAGEGPALLTAACLSMNYVAASGAVARSWGDKCAVWMAEEMGDRSDRHGMVVTLIDGGGRGSFSPLALAISTGSIVLLLNGVKESKRVTNVFTALKAGVAIFMVVMGLFYTKPSNWSPFVPEEFGVPGILRGATGTFFGYLGYDSVCCLGGEAINPKRNLPIAILGTLGGVSILYVLATLALTGMQPYQEISSVSGFPQAFYALDAKYAGQIAAAGEIATLPIVVLITIMAQPRLMLAMSQDGLLPPFFGQVDENGNLWHGTLVAGCVMIFVSTFVPFENLNDMISFAVLSILNMTDSSLILLWHEAPPSSDPKLPGQLLVMFHAAALTTAISCSHYNNSTIGKTVAAVAICTMVASVVLIYRWCPRATIFGGRAQEEYHSISHEMEYFQTPFVPFWPCFGICINWFLIAQLELKGIACMMVYLALVIAYYFCYAKHKSVGNTIGWREPPLALEMPELGTSDRSNSSHSDGAARRSIT